jgi:hypothetical protein
MLIIEISMILIAIILMKNNSQEAGKVQRCEKKKLKTTNLSGRCDIIKNASRKALDYSPDSC